MKLFLQKKYKNFERWGLRLQTHVPPATGGFAPKPPASGGWGLRPQNPQAAPPPLRISGYAPDSYGNVTTVIYLYSLPRKHCLFTKGISHRAFLLKQSKRGILNALR